MRDLTKTDQMTGAELQVWLVQHNFTIYTISMVNKGFAIFAK